MSEEDLWLAALLMWRLLRANPPPLFVEGGFACQIPRFSNDKANHVVLQNEVEVLAANDRVT